MHQRKAVVVGGGPAGLEAARVLAERGHKVTLFEANHQLGGQLSIATRNPRRRDLDGIIRWRAQECERLGVDLQCGTLAEAADILAEDPDVVIIATGGIPNTRIVDADEGLVHDTWQVHSREVRPTGTVLVFDDNGEHAALSAAEVLARDGADVEYATPERIIAPLVGATSYPGYLKAFAEHDVRTTLNSRVTTVARRGDGRLEATLFNEYGQTTTTRIVDHVIVEHGTTPIDDVYFDLKDKSSNLGAIDQQKLLALEPQDEVRNADGAFQLFRVGDAVSSRNVHAAILDAFRLCLAI